MIRLAIIDGSNAGILLAAFKAALFAL